MDSLSQILSHQVTEYIERCKISVTIENKQVLVFDLDELYILLGKVLSHLMYGHKSKNYTWVFNANPFNPSGTKYSDFLEDNPDSEKHLANLTNPEFLRIRSIPYDKFFQDKLNNWSMPLQELSCTNFKTIIRKIKKDMYKELCEKMSDVLQQNPELMLRTMGNNEYFVQKLEEKMNKKFTSHQLTKNTLILCDQSNKMMDEIFQSVVVDVNPTQLKRRLVSVWDLSLIAGNFVNTTNFLKELNTHPQCKLCVYISRYDCIHVTKLYNLIKAKHTELFLSSFDKTVKKNPEMAVIFRTFDDNFKSVKDELKRKYTSGILSKKVKLFEVQYKDEGLFMKTHGEKKNTLLTMNEFNEFVYKSNVPVIVKDDLNKCGEFINSCASNNMNVVCFVNTPINNKITDNLFVHKIDCQDVYKYNFSKMIKRVKEMMPDEMNESEKVIELEQTIELENYTSV